MNTVVLILGGGGLALDVAALAIVLRREWRQYFWLTAYLVVLVLTTIVDAAGYAVHGGYTTATAQVYWINDSLRSLMIMVLVFTLVRKYLTRTNPRLAFWVMPAFLALVAAEAIGRSGHGINRAMSYFSRDTSLAAALIVFVLWTAMMRTRHLDKMLFGIVAGLGVALAGVALGFGIKVISRSPIAQWGGYLAILIAHNLCAMVWIYTFRGRRGEVRRSTFESVPAESPAVSVRLGEPAPAIHTREQDSLCSPNQRPF